MYYLNMNNEQDVMLKLIKQSQFGSSEHISFDYIDSDDLYNEALHQSVLGLVASEIPNEFSTDIWHKTLFRQKSCYIQYCHAQDELKKLFVNADIPFVILKGNASAVYYRDPSLRMMGDIDLIVPSSYFDEANKLLTTSGYKWNHNTERHSSYKCDNLIIELHNRFSHEFDIEDYIVNGLNNIVIASVEGYEFPMLPRLANGLVLLDHMREHMKGAIGLRHIIDWMMYVYRNVDDNYWESEFKQVAQKNGMEVFAIHVTRMCQLYLGLTEEITWCNSADDKTCKTLLELILSTGNFGKKNGRGKSIESVSTGIHRKGLFTWLQHVGEHNWGAYHKHSWLKPFCWLYQICRYINQISKSGRKKNQLVEDLNRSKTRVNLLKKMEIF